MKDSLSRIVANRYGGRNIPVALVLPDGGRVALSEAPEVDIYARTWNGLRALASPELGRLARAYVRDDLDFSGGSQRMLDIAETPRRQRTTRPRTRPGPGGAVVAPATRQPAQHPAPLRRLQRVLQAWLDERMVYSCAYFRDRSRHARSGASAEARPHLPQADAASRRGVPRHRMRLGRPDFPCGAGLRRQGDRHHAVAKPVRLRARTDQRARSCGSRAGRIARLPRPAARASSTTRSPASACSSMSASATIRATSARSTRILKPGGLVLNHGITLTSSASTASAAASAISSRNTCFPVGSSPMSRG